MIFESRPGALVFHRCEGKLNLLFLLVLILMQSLAFMISPVEANANTVGRPISPVVWERVRTQLPAKQVKDIKLVLLDVWASWCEPCRESFPYYEKLNQRWQKEGLFVVGLNMDSKTQSAEEFLRDVPVSFSIIYDQDKKLRDALAVETLPRLYILSESGSILRIVRGSTPASQHELDLFISDFFKNKRKLNNKENK